MLTAPALATAGGQLGLQHRGGVGEHAGTQRLDVLGNAVAELLQALAHHLVVVAPPGVNRHNRLGGASQAAELLGLPVRRGAGGQVVHAGGDDTDGAGQQLGRAGALEAMRSHVMHVAMKACRQPGR